MADELRREIPLPPIANALEHFARSLRAAAMPPGVTVPAAPIRQQVAQMDALLAEVADVELRLMATTAELERIRPAGGFLAICREAYAQRWVFEHDEPDKMLATILHATEAAFSDDVGRQTFINLAAKCLSAVEHIDSQADAIPAQEAAHG